jgi:hypothetical protein
VQTISSFTFSLQIQYVSDDLLGGEEGSKSRKDDPDITYVLEPDAADAKLEASVGARLDRRESALEEPSAEGDQEYAIEHRTESNGVRNGLTTDVKTGCTTEGEKASPDCVIAGPFEAGEAMPEKSVRFS